MFFRISVLGSFGYILSSGVAGRFGGGKGVQGLSKKEKGLIGMDNRVVIAGGRMLQGD